MDNKKKKKKKQVTVKNKKRENKFEVMKSGKKWKGGRTNKIDVQMDEPTW